MMRHALPAEFSGSAGLLLAVAGSGIMGEELSGGNTAIALLANALANGFALYTLIQAFRPVFGAHFNPAVSLVATIRGRLRLRALPAYLNDRLVGPVVGARLAHLMFDLPMFADSRAGARRSRTVCE